MAPGQHVHTHNLAFSRFDRGHTVGGDVRPVAYVDTPATFDGIVRAELAEADQRVSAFSRRVATSRGLGLATVLLACGLGTVGMLAVGSSAVASGANRCRARRRARDAADRPS